MEVHRFSIRPLLVWVLLVSMYGVAHLFAASDKAGSAGLDGNRLSIELSGRPLIETSTFRRGGDYYYVVSFHHSVLTGAPRRLSDTTLGVAAVEVAQYSRTPDIVRVLIRSDHAVGLPYRTVHQGGDRYLVTMAIIPPSHFKVFLDVGHGGYDPGGTGPDGLPESMVNLSVAKHMAQLLRNQGIRVELDRTDNTFVSLAARVALADRSGADLFLGLYCNASSNRSVHGTTTYYYHDNSYHFARYLEDRVANGLGLSNDGVMKDNLYVIRNTTTRIPDVLIEYAYISNYHEEHLLASASFRRRIASALSNAVVSYFLGTGSGATGGTSGHGGSSSTGGSAPAAGQVALPSGPAQVIAVAQPNATVTIESIGRPSIDSFTMKNGNTTYFVVNLENTTLTGGHERFGIGPPFSGEVTIDQFSLSPDIVRVAVREDYSNSYQIYTQRGQGNRFVTTIYPVAN